MALVGVEPEPLVSEPDALTTRPPPWFKVFTVFAPYVFVRTKTHTLISCAKIIYKILHAIIVTKIAGT